MECNDYDYNWNNLLCDWIIKIIKGQFDKKKKYIYIYVLIIIYIRIKANVKVNDGEWWY